MYEECVEVDINERIFIYEKKLKCYEKHLQFRDANRKLELYRGTFYSEISGKENTIKSDIPEYEVVKF